MGKEWPVDGYHVKEWWSYYKSKSVNNKKEKMDIRINQTAIELGKAAGASAAELIREAIKTTGTANIILATGTSQFETLKQLILEPGIDWGKVVMFHLDEYIGLPITHPASFRKYLIERFITKVPALKAAHLINGGADPK